MASGRTRIMLAVRLVVLLAVDHPWRLDITALAGILAAAGTALLALFTWRLASDTRRLAYETAEDVRAEWRPVVIPEGNEHYVEYASGQEVGTLLLSLSNAGRGPAINVFVEATSETSVGSRRGDVTLGTMAPGKSVPARISGLLFRDSSGDPQRSRLEYYVTVTYEDLSKSQHETVLRLFDDARGSHQWPSAHGTAERFEVVLDETEIVPRNDAVSGLSRLARMRNGTRILIRRIRTKFAS